MIIGKARVWVLTRTSDVSSVEINLWRENEFTDLLRYVELVTEGDDHLVTVGSEADGYVKFSPGTVAQLVTV